MKKNSIKEIFKNLRGKFRIKKNEFNISEESMLEELHIGTEIIDNIEKEKYLSIDSDKLVKLYEKEISEEYKVFMEKRGLELSSFVDSFRRNLELTDFEEIPFKESFEEYLEGSLIEYAEYEEYREKRYGNQV